MSLTLKQKRAGLTRAVSRKTRWVTRSAGGVCPTAKKLNSGSSKSGCHRLAGCGRVQVRHGQFGQPKPHRQDKPVHGAPPSRTARYIKSAIPL